MTQLVLTTTGPCVVCQQVTAEAVLHNHQTPYCHHAHCEALTLAARYAILGMPGVPLRAAALAA